VHSDGERFYAVEVIDAEFVEHRDVVLDRDDAERLPVWASPPAVQTAVAAATGFVAGAATVALLRRYAQARLERESAVRQLPLGRARTYLVQVRQLG